MTGARGRFLVLFAVAVLIPLVVWWPEISGVLQGEEETAPPAWDAIAMGDPGGRFTLIDSTETEVEVDTRDGKRPTVVWFWSAMCPCIPDCEERIRALIARFPSTQVRFFAVDPNPNDTREHIESLRTELKSTYPVYRDPTSRIVYRMGVTASASVAVFDAEGKLSFRGAIDDDIYEPTVSYVQGALEGLLAGKPFKPREAEPYGCAYPPLEPVIADPPKSEPDPPTGSEPETGAQAWDDDAFLKQTLAEACDQVEQVCGAAFKQRPTLRKADEKQLYEVLYKEQGDLFQKMGADGEAGARHTARALAGALAAKFEFATRIIHIAPVNIRRIAKLIGTPEMITPDLIRILLIHEAAHALDFERFPQVEKELRGRATKEGIQAVGAIVEGHAQFVAEEAASRAKLSASFASLARLIVSPPASDDPAARLMADAVTAEARFSYVKGHAFVRAVYAARGRAGLDALLAAPPKTIREIERPKTYLDPDSASEGAIDFEPALLAAEKAVQEAGIKSVRQRLMRTALMGVYRPLGAERAEALLEGFSDGWTVHGSGGTGSQLIAVALMAFETDAGADHYVKEMEALLRAKDELLEKSASIKVASADYSTGVGKGGKRPGVFCRKVMEINVPQLPAPSKQVIKVHGAATGRFAVELTLLGMDWKREKEDALLEALLKTLEPK